MRGSSATLEGGPSIEFEGEYTKFEGERSAHHIYRSNSARSNTHGPTHPPTNNEEQYPATINVRTTTGDEASNAICRGKLTNSRNESTNDPARS